MFTTIFYLVVVTIRTSILTGTKYNREMGIFLTEIEYLVREKIFTG